MDENKQMWEAHNWKCVEPGSDFSIEKCETYGYPILMYRGKNADGKEEEKGWMCIDKDASSSA